MGHGWTRTSYTDQHGEKQRLGGWAALDPNSAETQSCSCCENPCPKAVLIRGLFAFFLFSVPLCLCGSFFRAAVCGLGHLEKSGIFPSRTSFSHSSSNGQL